jgi:hypothetical protein
MERGAQESFRLWLPRLTGNTYMGERWVSPPVYDIVSTGLSYSLPTKVEGRDANGLPVAISPDWIPADPAMVTVSPTLGSAVTITVQSPGETSLQIASEGIPTCRRVPIGWK